MNRQSVENEIKQIPKEKFWRKVKRTAVGVLFVAAAASGGYWLKWNMWVVLALFGVGMHIISGELVEKAVKFLLATAKDVVAIVVKRNGKTD